MRYSKLSLVGMCSVAAIKSLTGASDLRAGTTYVLTSSESSPTAFVNSGLNTKSFWALGVGKSNSFSNSGNSAYSSETGGDVTPEQANVPYETLSQFVVNEQGDMQGTPTFITGGQLVQLNGNQEFLSEIFVSGTGAHDVGSTPVFNYTLSQNAPYYVRSVNPVPNLPGGTLVQSSRTATVTVPTPEPAALSSMALAGLGLLLLRRRPRA